MDSERPTWRRAVVWLVAAGAVVAVGWGAVMAYTGYRQTAGPGGAVKGYFAALARGDAPAALGFGAPPEGVHTLLTSRVLKQQQAIAPIRDVTVVDTVTHGSAATVTVHYVLGFRDGPKGVTEQVAVHRHDGAWRLAATAATTSLDLTGALERATVAGGAVPDNPAAIFPGALPVTFDTPYLQLAPSTRYVRLSAPADTTVTVQVSPAGRAVIVPALATMLSACLRAGPVDPRCPLPSDRVVPGTLRGTLANNALAHLQVQVQTDRAGLIAVAVPDLSMHASYQQLDFNNRPFPMSGPVTLHVAATTYAVAPVRLNWSSPS